MNAVHPLFTSLMRFTSQAAWVEVRRWKCDLRGISCCRPVLLLFHGPFHAPLFWLYLIFSNVCFKASHTKSKYIVIVAFGLDLQCSKLMKLSVAVESDLKEQGKKVM